MLTEKDTQQLERQGISKKDVNDQLERFKKGYPQLNIVAPATPENGIKMTSKEDKEKYITLYKKKSKNADITKFVPASGAASRMFKKIFEVLDAYDGSEEKYLEMLTDRSASSVYTLVENIHEFAFYRDLAQICKEKGECIESKFEKKDYAGALDLLVSERGLNYGHYPKGLIKFHKYKNDTRTALEEHLVEGAMYAASKKTVNIHFTISPEFEYDFQKHVKAATPIYEERFGITYNIEFSNQKRYTDTVAVDLENKLERNEDGEIILRPGGHGSLIENLNEIDADLIFIKNIDNVVTDRLKDITVEYKELLGGVLFDKKEKVFNYLQKLTGNEEIGDAYLTKVSNFCNEELNIYIPDSFKSSENKEKIEFLVSQLNRPMRVCGMVKNEDEPGGGPFWVEDKNGLRSLQIVESSQFDTNDKEQMKVFNTATHFNPVDIACSTKNYKGEKFDLTKYIDIETGFISEKSYKGKTIKALEHPGLWNGAMSNWITIFVEVPMETFNPVKVINDLLRKEHRF
ncbi:MAG: DUF4301 domain-containing protein [Salinivirgaceae bacterium]|nr:MAG: DUF4301 domain-containing protein [Salinivirgaceae bacterium]